MRCATSIGLLILARSASSLRVAPARRLATRTRASVDPYAGADQRPVVLYDGICRMCNFWVDWALANDPAPGRLRFAALQSAAGRRLLERSGRAADDISSIVLVTRDAAFVKSAAVLEIGREIGAAAPLAALTDALVPRAVADAAYDAVAANRYRVAGKLGALRVDDAARGDRFLA